MRNAVFGQNAQAQPGNQFGNAVVDFRIQVVRPARKNNAARSAPNKFFEGMFALLVNFAAEFFLLVPAGIDSVPYFFKR